MGWTSAAAAMLMAGLPWAQGPTGPEVEEARRLLESLPTRVSDAAFSRRTQWLDESVDRTLADEARVRVLKALTAL